jgi:general secretion pathway protein G
VSDRKSRKQRGFTLIELLIVMAIIGMLAALVGPNIYKRLFSAQRDAAAAQISQIETQIATYMLDMRKSPSSLEDLVENRGNSPAWDGPYLKSSQLKDPWGNPYQYRRPGRNKREYDLLSYGADGQEGGEGDNADIVNWE